MKHTVRLCLIAIFIIGCTFSVSGNAAVQAENRSEFETLMEKVRLGFLQNPNIESDLKKFNDLDGSFTDVDYASTQRTKWPPLTHLERIYDFTFAYTNPQSKHYKDELLFANIQKGLEFWHQRNPWCNNWWYNQIAEPQLLGVLLIQMRIGEKLLPDELEKQLLQRIEKDGGHPAKWTGANRTDIALHWIYRSCLTESEADLTLALENAYSPVVYTTKEGFQHDNSYFQHGQQLYIGGYGDEILKGITQIALYTKGTRYAIPAEKLELLSTFMRQTYYPTIRGEYMLFDVLGRGVSRPNITNKTYTALFAERMMELDPTHANEFKAIIERLKGKQPASHAIAAKHTHYFRGDYTLHTRPEYTFDVRMVSNRTMRCEYGNGENLKTYFMSDGCTNIVMSGDEYANIFPVWNWNRIPGVTAPQLNEIPKAKSDWQTPGTSTFAGGVSDSLHGVSAYAYTDNYAGVNTSARKAWFFFDKEVVCLGAEIRSTASAQVLTTINQCLLKEKDILVSSKKKVSTVTEGTFNYTSPEWLLHNQIGYLFPKGGDIFVTNQTQSGSWYDINNSAEKEMCHEKVFTIGVDHGQSPSNGNYAYVIVPGMPTVKEIQKYQKSNPIEILANTKEMQVVRNKKSGIWQMVFYTKGEFTCKDITVIVDKGCTLMLKEINKKEMNLHVSDPGQTLSSIEVSLYMPAKSKESKKLNCDFRNSGIYAGSTQAYRIQF